MAQLEGETPIKLTVFGTQRNPVSESYTNPSWTELASFNGPVGPAEVNVHDTSLLVNKLFVHYNETSPLFGIKTQEPVEIKRQPTHVYSSKLGKVLSL